jgi:ATP-dependent DNA helicase RecG
MCALARASTTPRRPAPVDPRGHAEGPARLAAAAAVHPREQARRGPNAFGARERLTWARMLAAPVRVPRPSRLRARPASTGRLAGALEALGVRSVGDLLEHLPREQRELRALRELCAGEPATVAVEVRSIRTRKLRRRGLRPLVEATVFDATASRRAAFFNQPWLAQRYAPGTRLLLYGKLDAGGALRVWSHAPDPDGRSPAAPVRSPEERETPSEISHYPAAEGISSTQLASLVRASQAALGDVVEALPAAVRTRQRLPERATALAVMHFGDQAEERELARRRLAFDELLLGQLVLLRRRALRGARRASPPLRHAGSLSARWRERSLPFELTADQRRATQAIDRDLARSFPMQRLLIGEVGSGKTVVALHAMLRACEHGHQAALMAPTETLAEQHFATLSMLLANTPLSLALLSSSTGASARRKLLAELAGGRLAIVVGTHALIEPEVCFRSLAVAVVDEQHRFGVRQRARLDEKGPTAGPGGRTSPPHILHMTATPIPRTLALATYGDLDVSLLRTLPRGRGPVGTRIVTGAAARERAYRAVRSELEAGRQAYVVCPLVSEVDVQEPADAVAGGSELRAANAELDRLQAAELAGFRLVLLHGQLRAAEKQAAMAAFAAGAADVLVSTTVIEVGIDVPNATVMIVENAERFGISQLHQLRGRVGRGEHRSLCLLMTSREGARSERLRALAAHGDGFRLAEIDLRLRGRGELAGLRQSGGSAYRVASLPDDEDLLIEARSHAEAIMAADEELRGPQHALLRDALVHSFGSEALAPIRA